MESKLDYKNKIENKLAFNMEYVRYKIETVNGNLFPLFNFLFGVVLVGNAILFYALCKCNKKKKSKYLKILLHYNFSRNYSYNMLFPL